MKRATFFFRNRGLIITAVDDSHTAQSIAQRMCAGGFIIGRDDFWGKEEEVPINLADVSTVILEDMTVEGAEG